jgi:hypothetical protein
MYEDAMSWVGSFMSTSRLRDADQRFPCPSRGPAAESLAPGDLATGREAEPGGELLLGGPTVMSSPISATTLRAVGRIDSVDSGEIHAREAMEVLARMGRRPWTLALPAATPRA